MASKYCVDVNKDAASRKSCRRPNKASVRDALDFINQGSYLTKVKRGKKFRRYFVLPGEDLILEYTDSKKIFRKPPKFNLNNLKEVRRGQNSEGFNLATMKTGKRFADDCCFTLIFDRKKTKTLDLVASDHDTCDKWIRGIKSAVARKRSASLAKKEDIWIKDHFKRADKNKDGSLSLGEIEKLLPTMNIFIKKSKVKEMFEAANTSKVVNKKGSQALELEEFVDFCNTLTKRPEISEIFDDYVEDGRFMTVRELGEFLKEEQMAGVLTDVALCQLIEKYEPSPEVRESGVLSATGFQYLLTNEEMLFNPKHNKVYQPMTRPLNQYYINSSHNTYLTDNQLTGKSSIEAYVKALQKGCRCVELDCWDGPNDEPIIYHGYTLTSKILFRDVIKVINDYAFSASPYPVILSIENHCSVDQQRVMASILREILGDKLYIEPLTPSSEALPSPEALKGRILVKGKKFSSSPLPAASLSEEDQDVSDEDEAADIESEDVQKKVKEKAKKTLKLAKELSDIVVCCKSVSFKGFDNAIKNNKVYEMSSIVENKMKRLVESDGANFVRNNRNFLVRIYPNGLRTDSSNYNPTLPWSAGCQIVALNFQTWTKALQLNCGKFLDNGGSGYVLKPDIIVNPSQGIQFNPSGPYDPKWQKKVEITVISAFQLPKSSGSDITDPYIKVKIYGVEEDKAFYKTKTIPNNGFNPIWNESTTFIVKVPQLAIVRFVVKDNNSLSDRNIGTYCLPFSSLMPGYRHAPLYLNNGVKAEKTFLFIHVDFK